MKAGEITCQVNDQVVYEKMANDNAVENAMKAAFFKMSLELCSRNTREAVLKLYL